MCSGRWHYRGNNRYHFTYFWPTQPLYNEFTWSWKSSLMPDRCLAKATQPINGKLGLESRTCDLKFTMLHHTSFSLSHRLYHSWNCKLKKDPKTPLFLPNTHAPCYLPTPSRHSLLQPLFSRLRYLKPHRIGRSLAVLCKMQTSRTLWSRQDSITSWESWRWMPMLTTTILDLCLHVDSWAHCFNTSTLLFSGLLTCNNTNVYS